MLVSKAHKSAVAYVVYIIGQIMQWGSWLAIGEILFALIIRDTVGNSPYVLMCTMVVIYATQYLDNSHFQDQDLFELLNWLKDKFVAAIKRLVITFWVVEVSGLIDVFYEVVGIAV
ncbi:hypothetical protein [Vibrio agarivorans]|uniref:hypothetical protein n=1 Tax=Vibrio agarivorans TaxID=153622 RepID=UPI0025B4BBF0|nr:hypothetical protein [Vibrio agarivorans]MDN3661113.1 hypothetical protein [Vibrio agarivorans]